MPGKIESIPFLSQIEDVDEYLLEYRSLKLTSPTHSSSYSSGGFQHHHAQGQLRFNGSSTGKVGNDAREAGIGGKFGANGETLPTGNYKGQVEGTAMVGNYGNGVKSSLGVAGFNGSMMANRKKYVGNGNQGYRYNNHPNAKYGVQYASGPVQQQQQQQQQPGLVQNTMIANHFKQVYPQMGYNGSGSGSNLALDQLGSSFMVPNRVSQQGKASQTQQSYPSGTSSPSPAPPRVDTALSGGSSISSYSSNSVSAHFSASHASQFPNFLDSGLVSSSSIVSGIPSSTNIYNSANGDAVGGYSSSSLTTDGRNSTGTPLSFEPVISTPVLVSEPISSDRAAGDVNLGSFEAPTASMTSNSTSNLLMGDYSAGWGSNHANTPSNANGAFGIWNNDMSVWS